jgi:hypothetical protein
MIYVGFATLYAGAVAAMLGAGPLPVVGAAGVAVICAVRA